MKRKFSPANQNQIRNHQPRLRRNTLILGRSDNGKDFSAKTCRNANNAAINCRNYSRHRHIDRAESDIGEILASLSDAMKVKYLFLIYVNYITVN